MTETESLERQTVIYNLIDTLRDKDNWCGETHVQKTTYFLEELTGHVLGYPFILYKHGPYSFELSEDLSAMGAFRFIEDEIAHPAYGPRLKPNREIKQMLQEKFGTLTTELADPIKFVVGKLSGYGVVTLERLATALYFTTQKPVEGDEARARQIHIVKSHISAVLALDAVKIVNTILEDWKHREPQIEPPIDEIRRRENWRRPLT